MYRINFKLFGLRAFSIVLFPIFINAAETLSECARALADIASMHSDDPLKWRLEYQRTNLRYGLTPSEAVTKLIEKNPQARLITIGEEHGDPNSHLETIRNLKKSIPDLDALFLEVDSTLTPLLWLYHQGVVDVDLVMEELKDQWQAKSHITRELLILTKELGIRIIGVEMLQEKTVRFSSMINLNERNSYTSRRILNFLNYYDLFASFKNPGQTRGNSLVGPFFRPRKAIYIGGAGHLIWRNSEFRSVSDALSEQGISLLKILSISTDGQAWNLGTMTTPSGDAGPSTASTFGFLPSGQTPILFPPLPILNTDQVDWSEGDLILVRPGK